MGEYQEWGINESVVIELALSEYEARLKDLSPDPRQRYIDRFAHKVEGAEGDTERLRVVANMQKQIPALFEPASPAFIAIWERFFGVIETLPEAERLTLTAEAYAERRDAFLAGLGEDDRRLLKAEPAERYQKSWENLTCYINDHKLYMYLPILIGAVSLRFERTGDGEDVLRRLESLQDADPEDLQDLLPEVAQAVQAHKPGSSWPECVVGPAGEINDRLFKITHSRERAIALFCRMYGCSGQETALNSAVKRSAKSARKKKGSI